MSQLPVKVTRNVPGCLEVRVGYDLTDLHRALDGITDVWLTFGHPEFGIECTMARGDKDATVTKQPDGVTAIINARNALDATGAAHDE